MTIPTTMRAAVLRDHDPTLRIETIPTPVPRRGEALVRVAACGVCHTDLHVMKGEVAFPRPAVLGHEISGTVVSLGPDSGASPVRVGDRVVGGFIMPCGDCRQCLRGRDDLCEQFFAMNRLRGTLYDGESRLAMPDGSFLAMYSMGGLAEYAVVPLTALAILPDGVPMESACVLGCAGLTSYGAVFSSARVGAEDVVVVVGVGGVGGTLVQFARIAGATRVIAIDIAREKLELARGLGATDTVDASVQDAVAAVRELSGGGADVVFEALGAPQTFGQASRMLADGGRMVAVGIAAGTATAEVEITPLVRRGHTITGSFGGRTRRDLPEVVALAAAGDFAPERLVTRRFALGQADEAYGALDRREIAGRAVVVMDD